MFNPNSTPQTPIVSTVIDVQLRGLRRASEDRLFDGWGINITPTRLF
jgi:hypothetical protein